MSLSRLAEAAVFETTSISNRNKYTSDSGDIFGRTVAAVVQFSVHRYPSENGVQTQRNTLGRTCQTESSQRCVPSFFFTGFCCRPKCTREIAVTAIASKLSQP